MQSLCSFSCGTDELLSDELFLWQVLGSDASSIRIILSEAQGNVESLGSYTKQKYSLKYRLKHRENVTALPLFLVSFLSARLTSFIVLFLSFPHLTFSFVPAIQWGSRKCGFLWIMENLLSFINPPVTWAPPVLPCLLSSPSGGQRK